MDEAYFKEELNGIKDEIRMIRECQVQIRVEIAGLKVKAGIWGIIGAAIPTVSAILFMLIRGIS